MEGVKRWTATYTKHLQQKRKVYQDGVLELSHSNQKILLYDDCGKLLDSRLLKKDEVVQSGGSLEFETYLVDVGNPDSSDKRVNLDGQKEEENFTRIALTGRSISNLGSKNIVRHKAGNLEDIPNGTRDTITEWHVLYTKQKFQKAKKFHDGFLRLIASGHQRGQVILLSEDGMALDKMYLKFSDDLSTGSTYEMANYLVEIGKLKNCYGSGALLVNHSKTSEQESDDSSKQTLFRSFNSKNKQRVTSNMKTTATTKPLRNACQILFDLKKPTAPRVLIDNGPSMEQSLHQETPQPGQSDLIIEAKAERLQNKMNLDETRRDYKCQNSTDTASSSNRPSLVKDASDSLTVGFSDLIKRDLNIREKLLSNNSAPTFGVSQGSSDCMHFVANEEVNFNQLDGANNTDAGTQHGKEYAIKAASKTESCKESKGFVGSSCATEFPCFDLGI